MLPVKDIMKYALLFLIFPIMIASFKGSEKTNTSSVSVAAPSDTAAYQWFLKLLKSGEEIPHAAIEEHTPIAKAFGYFRATEAQFINGELCTVILEHREGNCKRLFTMKLDKFQVLDMELISEKCE